MSNKDLDRRIRDFMHSKFDEMPELRSKGVDELISDLASEGRQTSIF